MYVYQMTLLSAVPYMERHWHVIEGGLYLGKIETYWPGQIENTHNKYDLWVVDGGETLLLQFGHHEGLNLSYPINTIKGLPFGLNDRSTLWAYAYHMYLRSREHA